MDARRLQNQIDKTSVMCPSQCTPTGRHTHAHKVCICMCMLHIYATAAHLVGGAVFDIPGVHPTIEYCELRTDEIGLDFARVCRTAATRTVSPSMT